MKKLLRTKSARLPLKRKYTIIKKIKEHRRKLKRELKKHPEKKRKPRQDKGVPNSCPFKEQILMDIEKERQIKEAEIEARREEAKQRRKQLRQEKLADKRNVENLADMVSDAQKRSNAFDKQGEEENTTMIDTLHDGSAKAFIKEFRKVVEAADVILEVLDARDPIGTRCPAVEKAVIDAGTSKRLVLILNKADLVPKENLISWLKYLRNELPAIAFKASTQIQSSKLGRGRKKFLSSTADVQTSKCLGADTLMTLLGNYARNKGIKTAIRVGVVGLPNVGKSSIINSLKRSKSCNVGAVPGVTKTMQEVALDSKIMLLDSPGIVLATGDSNDSTVALRNALRIDSLEDAISPVEIIIKRTGKEYMMLQYGLGNFESTQEFLCLLAKRMGRLRKGAIPDANAAAKRILNDWNSGKIKYFTCPPETFSSETHLSAAIVSEMAKEFSLDDIDFKNKETEEMEELPLVAPSTTVAVETIGPVTIIGDSAEVEQMDTASDTEKESEHKENKVKISQPRSKKSTGRNAIEESSKKNPELLLAGNQRVNKLKKIKQKKEKKSRARRERLGEALSEKMTAAFGGLGPA